MSHHRKNSERDRVISKKWIYSDSERSARHRRSVSHRGGRVWPQNVAWLVFIGWVISYANEWEGYSDCILEGVEISGIWSTAHSVVFWQGLGTVTAPLGVSLHLLLEDQDLVLSAILVPFDSNQFMLCPWAMSFFQKLCPASFPPVTVSWRQCYRVYLYKHSQYAFIYVLIFMKQWLSSKAILHIWVYFMLQMNS